MDISSEYIRFSGQLLFERENGFRSALTPQQKEQYCIMAQENLCEALFYYFLKDDLPEPFRLKFRNIFQIESVKRLLEKEQLDKFYHLLESEKIPFVPIKGADLAFRIYPNPALRRHGDWDILFRKEDCSRVTELLQQHGFQTFSGYKPDVHSSHHYEPMHNKRQSIEIHWTLPHFGTAGPDDIWKETEGLNEYHRILTPEMNLLLISAHAGNHNYRLSPWKILLDAGFILKHDSVDWSKVHELADRWGILRPDILIGAWSEFFPAGTLPAESPDQTPQKLIRETFEMYKTAAGHSPYEHRMASCKRFDLRWFLDRFKYYTPSSICLKYHLTSKQHKQIILCGIRDFFGKVSFFLTHMRSKNPELQHLYQNIEKINNLAKKKI